MREGRELYIYWRLASADRAAACRATLAMQDDLKARHPHLECRLLLRCGDAEQPTLMEVYRHPKGVDAALEAAIDDASGVLLAWCVGERHVEAFAQAQTPTARWPWSGA